MSSLFLVTACGGGKLGFEDAKTETCFRYALANEINTMQMAKVMPALQATACTGLSDDGTHTIDSECVSKQISDGPSDRIKKLRADQEKFRKMRERIAANAADPAAANAFVEETLAKAKATTLGNVLPIPDLSEEEKRDCEAGL